MNIWVRNIISCTLRMSFWIINFFKGGKIIRHYKNICLIQNCKENGIKYKGLMLKKVLEHAVLHSSFYSGIDPSSLKNFPITNKSILIENSHRILVDMIYLPWQKGPYYIQKTSGSTGTPFSVPQDSRKRNRRLAELKYFGNIVGFKSHDKLVHLRIWTKWQKKTKLQSFKENIVPFDISNLNEEHLGQLYQILQKTKAKCLRGYASSLELLARYIESHHLKQLPHLKIVIATSETLYDSTRELVKKYIGCQIISQYANEENGLLAQQKIGDTNFYLNNSSYFWEVLKYDIDEPAEYGELGRIVLTDLFNYSFPLIRYENGDACILQIDKKTNCPYIEKLYGRRLDLIYNTKQEPIFPMVLARILKNYSDIIQWQFIQETKIDYRLRIVSKNGSEIQAQKEIINQLHDKFGADAKIYIDYVREIPVLKSGKRKSVICNLKL